MAVEKSKIVARIKGLYPNANLSQARMDELSDRLSKLPADDADDTAIDAVINQANSFISFSDIAKQDDKVRGLEAKTKIPPKVDEIPKVEPIPDDAPDYVKAIMSKLDTVTSELDNFKKGQQSQSVQSKFSNHDDIKSIPASFLSGRAMPSTEDELPAFVEKAKTDWKNFATEQKLNFIGNDKPGGNGGDGGNPTEPSAEQIADVLKHI